MEEFLFEQGIDNERERRTHKTSSEEEAEGKKSSIWKTKANIDIIEKCFYCSFLSMWIELIEMDLPFSPAESMDE